MGRSNGSIDGTSGVGGGKERVCVCVFGKCHLA